jgi:hypothetical protein
MEYKMPYLTTLDAMPVSRGKYRVVQDTARDA